MKNKSSAVVTRRAFVPETEGGGSPDPALLR